MTKPADLIVSSTGLARFAGRRFVCSLGAGGVTTDKREGDAATPAGVFRLEGLFYRADRGAPPQTALPMRRLAHDDGWCDDPQSAAYNTHIRLPFEHSHEKLCRGDRLYDLVVIFDANRSPIQSGKGSALFMHIARRPRFPTLGCVALAERDLRWILARWRHGSRLIILPPHAGLLRAPKIADPTRTDVAPIATAIS